MAVVGFSKIIKEKKSFLLFTLAFFVIIFCYFVLQLDLKPLKPPILSDEETQPLPQCPSMPQYPAVFYAKGNTIEAKVIYFEPSLYGDVLVFNYPDCVRCMMIDGSNQSCWDFYYQAPVTYVIDIRRFFQNYLKNVEDVLVVGMGAGTLLREWSLNNVTNFKIDAVEINPKVIEAANNYFVLPNNLDYNVIIDDGRHFLRESDKKYDVIILDLCEIVDSNVHLWTEEFYELAKSKLKKDDSFLIVTLNVFRGVDKNSLDHMVANTLKRNFQNIYALDRGKDKINDWQMVVFFATQKPLDILSLEDFPLEEWHFASDDYFITDENSPKIIQYYFPVFEKIREETSKYFGPSILLGP